MPTAQTVQKPKKTISLEEMVLEFGEHDKEAYSFPLIKDIHFDSKAISGLHKNLEQDGLWQVMDNLLVDEAYKGPNMDGIFHTVGNELFYRVYQTFKETGDIDKAKLLLGIYISPEFREVISNSYPGPQTNILNLFYGLITKEYGSEQFLRQTTFTLLNLDRTESPEVVNYAALWLSDLTEATVRERNLLGQRYNILKTALDAALTEPVRKQLRKYATGQVRQLTYPQIKIDRVA